MANEIQLPETLIETTTSNNLFCQFDEQNGVLLLDVKNPFSEEDFATIAGIIDPFFEERGELAGIIINSKKFPYWRGAANRTQYLSFAQNNHYKFKKATFNMGGFFIKVVIAVARSRTRVEVKTFKYNQIEKAQSWILGI